MKQRLSHPAIAAFAVLVLMAPSAYLAAISVVPPFCKPSAILDRYMPLLPLLLDDCPVEPNLHRSIIFLPCENFISPFLHQINANENAD